MVNQRKQIVINKNYQYQYTLGTVALAILLLNTFLILMFLLPGASTRSLPSSVIYTIALFEIVIIGVTWYGSLRVSHRVAGPVYVISREVQKLTAGDFTARIALRKKDKFQDVAQELNGSFSALDGRLARIKQMAGEIDSSDWANEEQKNQLKALQSALAELKTHDI